MWNILKKNRCCYYRHYDDVIMGTIASQITSLTIVYSAVYSGADQSKHQSSASLAFVWGIHRGPVNSPHKWPLTLKCFHLMTSSWEDPVLMPFPEQEEALFNPHCRSVALLANIRERCLGSRDGEYNFNALGPSHEMNECLVLYQTPLVCFNARYRYLKARPRQISNTRD